MALDPKTLILASASPFRRHLMEQAGLQFDALAANVDERAIESPLLARGDGPEEIAGALALAKAMDVSKRMPGCFVIGSDQVMSMDGQLFHKHKTLAEAKVQLLAMRGRTHHLTSAMAIVRDRTCLWSHVDSAHMTLRHYSEDFLDSYIKRAGEKVLLSVGAYQYEGLGQQLFEKVEGDYFTIIGLPMLPLLSALRKFGVIDD